LRKKSQKVRAFYKKMTKNCKKYTFFLRFLQSDLSKRATFEPSTLSEVEGHLRPNLPLCDKSIPLTKSFFKANPPVPILKQTS
jgi:hypothetical protein